MFKATDCVHVRHYIDDSFVYPLLYLFFRFASPLDVYWRSSSLPKNQSNRPQDEYVYDIYDSFDRHVSSNHVKTNSANSSSSATSCAFRPCSK